MLIKADGLLNLPQCYRFNLPNNLQAGASAPDWGDDLSLGCICSPLCSPVFQRPLRPCRLKKTVPRPIAIPNTASCKISFHFFLSPLTLAVVSVYQTGALYQRTAYPVTVRIPRGVLGPLLRYDQAGSCRSRACSEPGERGCGSINGGPFRLE